MTQLPSYLQSESRGRRNKRRSENQESSVAASLGGKTIRGSGGGMEKGDVNTKTGYKIECKTTEANQITIKRSWLRKIECEAFDSGRRPMLVFDFEETATERPQRWVCIPESEFIALQGYIQ